MNDMFDNLKELKHKLKLEENGDKATDKAKKPTALSAKSAAKSSVTSKSESTEEKEARLRAEFESFMKASKIKKL